jgi:hypothetical protein
MTLNDDLPNHTTPHVNRHGAQPGVDGGHSPNALVIVAKYPQPGKVKTRLGATIGHDRAATLYTAFLRDLSERFTAGERTGERTGAYELNWACVDDTPDGADMRRLRPLLAVNEAGSPNPSDGPRLFAQRGADLAERLYTMCVDMRAAGYRRLIIHSSDSPHASLATVQDGFAQLATHDVVVGPAMDGGYYLIGLHLDELAGGAVDEADNSTDSAGIRENTDATTSFPDLFRGIGMSEPTTLQQALARANQLGLSIATLPMTFDVDEAADLTRLADHLRTHGAQAAPHTAAALRELAYTQSADDA